MHRFILWILLKMERVNTQYLFYCNNLIFGVIKKKKTYLMNNNCMNITVKAVYVGFPILDGSTKLR